MAEDRPKVAQFGDYLITERLGEGGMCHVFRARRRGSTQDCALKLLKEEQRQDERVVSLFLTEADVALLLEHPNLIHTYDAGEIDGRYYIAMELIEGATLGELVHRCQAQKLTLPVDVSLFVVSEILEGLQALHTAQGRTGRPLGLIHRDVTPHNIFLSFDGRVILGDFGVAHIQAYGEMEPGQAIGKIGYLAPEMALGEEVDQRADLFSLGVVLYELCTDYRLFDQGSDEELLRAITDGRVPKPRTVEPSLSRHLESIVLRALARRPKDRFASAEEMMYELEPEWSRLLGNPFAISALMAGLFSAEMREWRARQKRGGA